MRTSMMRRERELTALHRFLRRAGRRSGGSSRGSAVDAITNSTGKKPGLGKSGREEHRRADAADPHRLRAELRLDREDARASAIASTAS